MSPGVPGTAPIRHPQASPGISRRPQVSPRRPQAPGPSQSFPGGEGVTPPRAPPGISKRPQVSPRRPQAPWPSPWLPRRVPPYPGRKVAIPTRSSLIEFDVVFGTSPGVHRASPSIPVRLQASLGRPQASPGVARASPGVPRASPGVPKRPRASPGVHRASPGVSRASPNVPRINFLLKFIEFHQFLLNFFYTFRDNNNHDRRIQSYDRGSTLGETKP